MHGGWENERGRPGAHLEAMAPEQGPRGYRAAPSWPTATVAGLRRRGARLYSVAEELEAAATRKVTEGGLLGF